MRSCLTGRFWRTWPPPCAPCAPTATGRRARTTSRAGARRVAGDERAVPCMLRTALSRAWLLRGMLRARLIRPPACDCPAEPGSLTCCLLLSPQDRFCYGAYSYVPPGGRKAHYDMIGYPGAPASACQAGSVSAPVPARRPCLQAVAHIEPALRVAARTHPPVHSAPSLPLPPGSHRRRPRGQQAGGGSWAAHQAAGKQRCAAVA